MRTPGQAFDSLKELKDIKQHKADAAKEQLMPKLDSFAEKIEKEQEKAKEETKGDEV